MLWVCVVCFFYELLLNAFDVLRNRYRLFLCASSHLLNPFAGFARILTLAPAHISLLCRLYVS